MAFPHSGLTGLTTGDDHTQYLLLVGRSGGQIINGGTVASNNFTIRSNSSVTKGSVIFDETTASTSSAAGSVLVAGGISISNTTDATSSAIGGTFTTAGGVAVAKKAFIGTDLSVGGNSTFTGTSTHTGNTTFTGSATINLITDASSSTVGGSFTTAGGLAVAKKAFIGTDLSVGGNLISSNYIQTVNIATPTVPPASNIRFYTDTADSLLKSKDSSGIVTVYQPTTTKGDLLTRSSSTQIRLPVGNDGEILKADSTQSSGLKWAAESGGSGTVPARTINNTILTTDLTVGNQMAWKGSNIYDKFIDPVKSKYLRLLKVTQQAITSSYTNISFGTESNVDRSYFQISHDKTYYTIKEPGSYVFFGQMAATNNVYNNLTTVEWGVHSDYTLVGTTFIPEPGVEIYTSFNNVGGGNDNAMFGWIGDELDEKRKQFYQDQKKKFPV